MEKEQLQKELDAYAEHVRNVDNLLGMLDAFGVDEDHGTHQFEGTPLEDLSGELAELIEGGDMFAHNFFDWWLNCDCLAAKVNAELSLADWFALRYDSEHGEKVWRLVDSVSVEILIACGGPDVRVTVPVHAQPPSKLPICELTIAWWSTPLTVRLELPHLQSHVADMMAGY